MSAHKQMIQIETIWYNGGEMEVIRDVEAVKRLVAELERHRQAVGIALRAVEQLAPGLIAQAFKGAIAQQESNDPRMNAAGDQW